MERQRVEQTARLKKDLLWELPSVLEEVRRPQKQGRCTDTEGIHYRRAPKWKYLLLQGLRTVVTDNRG